MHSTIIHFLDEMQEARQSKLSMADNFGRLLAALHDKSIQQHANRRLRILLSGLGLSSVAPPLDRLHRRHVSDEIQHGESAPVRQPP